MPRHVFGSVSGTPARACLPDLLKQLFQLFNRLGREATNEEGTGIGLVTSKRLVELMEERSAWKALSVREAYSGST